MKKIEIDDELYHYIASQTQFIGETASDILRRLLKLSELSQSVVPTKENINKKIKKEFENTSNIKKEQVNELTFLLKHLDEVLNSDEFVDETKAVKRFLMILSALYFAAPDRFTYGTENIQGSERVYFAKNEETILATGSGVRAKQIPSSPFWVITNNNTARKGIILTKLMEAMDIPEESIERIKTFFIR
ncbi:replication initiation negative regulator SeqA [Pasteurella atlantica]|uniref:replication initiation negative regulator SeqA n=1 Tax=Pasteurellaceae TaxID=712 RepID=UPI00275B4A9E|nr:replication initiation negative regulator SeqA [Pasteurella atlantica]MDP8033506.1 replication initiation negative regulator SeqA [Pasteurella atlantica]MDP8035442.1 replication initiation negative regulator SeqA [Pasteurella atlantica]MDP8037393.1 replication initiation negative regulator SeqA [Pasteurella atlantica]MDP8047741.1 replication initiation negative regulator SeqA [Pasteurella atlantica]MDP8049698.1 replication initiation negative regulator SeqA [Pasteurella atlantica]